VILENEEDAEQSTKRKSAATQGRVAEKRAGAAAQK